MYWKRVVLSFVCFENCESAKYVSVRANLSIFSELKSYANFRCVRKCSRAVSCAGHSESSRTSLSASRLQKRKVKATSYEKARWQFVMSRWFRCVGKERIPKRKTNLEKALDIIRICYVKVMRNYEPSACCSCIVHMQFW